MNQLLSYLLYAAGIAFAFGLVIFVHEFGHFIVAKKSGVKVERFSFGLGPELVGFQWGETRYCIAWLPLGGEVRMAGEMVDDKGEPVVPDPSVDHSRDFFHQPWYRRIAIAFAGPLMNYVLAILIFFGILMIWGEPTQINKTEIGEVVAGMPAEKAGLMKGDKVLKVQDEAVTDFAEVATRIHARPDQVTTLVFDRAGAEQTVTLTPQRDAGGKTGLIGIRPADPVVERSKTGVLSAAKKAGWQCWNISYFTIAYLGQKISAREKPDMAGPLGIGQVIVKAVKSGAEDFFYLIGLISVAIGLFNLFPVPMLDGGHVLYYLIEGLRGKPLSHKVMAKANMVGLAMLLSLLVFATINDVQRFRGAPDEKPAVETPAAVAPENTLEAPPPGNVRFSRYFIPTLKETPADADTTSAKLMLRAGMIRKVAAGLYDWLPLGLRVLKKVENVIREEMNRAGAMEVWLPVIQPKELWEETGRWQFYGRELLRIKDRKNNEFCFAPTAEEMITDLARKTIKSSRELPVNFYQFGTKFRDEIRPRFGIMRSREFLMKDAYSFHATEADLDAEYTRMSETYSRIFTRLGLKFRPVEADSGAIGGNSSQEFMVLADTGEDLIASCSSCGYAANLERAEVSAPVANGKEAALPVEEVATPNATKVVDVARVVGTTADRIIKTVFMVADGQTVVALVRGDTDLNVPKFQKALGAKGLRPANEAEYVVAAGGSDVGFAGPQHIQVRMIADHLVAAMSNAVGGGGKKDVHLKNVNPGRDFKLETVADIRNIREGEPCPKCDKPVQFFRGIEVGHVFKLGTKYSAPMKCEFLDEGGAARPMIMGCYGIGVSRIVAAAIEQNNDEWGIQWPFQIAPFQVLVTPANVTHDESRIAAEKIYNGLLEKGVDVLLDDRDMRAGFKFKDADLIGIPYRVTIGEKSLSRGMVELKLRTEAQATEVPVDAAIEKVLETLKALA